MISILRLGVVAVLMAGCQFVAAADSPFNAVAPYVDQQAFVVGRLDVQQLSLGDLKSRAGQLLTQLTGDAGMQPQIDRVLDHAIQVREQFLAAGGQDVFLVVSPSDIPQRPPFFVITSSDPQKLDALESLVRELAKPDGNNMALRKNGDRALLLGSPPTLARVAGDKPEPRPEVTAAAAAVAPAPLQLLLVPNADQHRVLKETFPALPAPWKEVTGSALSDGVQWGVLTVTAAPTIKLQLVIQSKDATAAQVLKRLLDSSLDAAVQLPVVQQTVPEAGAIRKLIAPVVTGQQVSISLTDDAATLQAVARPVAAALEQARGASRRQMSINNLKQLALAMHVFHDANKRFPPAASCDAAGKPLLSWRVHILPYLDQEALYKMFKLDEPWDSEHNKKLIEAMPKVYVDTAAKLKPGLTTYVVPTGEGTVFGGKESLPLQEIRDGTSNTIMIVNAVPDKAVIWTKPEDLAVKEAEPLAGLVNDARKTFETAFCDGSVRMLSAAIDPKVLWILLGANDQQVVDFDQIR